MCGFEDYVKFTERQMEDIKQRDAEIRARPSVQPQGPLLADRVFRGLVNLNGLGMVAMPLAALGVFSLMKSKTRD